MLAAHAGNSRSPGLLVGGATSPYRRVHVNVPHQLGPYQLLRPIASGGMGVVYEGRHASLGRRVAVKVLKEEFAREHPEALERLRQEAQVTASLHHPHVVQVTDFEVGPPSYLVMELLGGESLRSRLRRGRLAPLEIQAVAEQLLSALSAAHDAGVVHRDIKPENLFLVATAASPVFVKVLDFGIAKLLDPQGAPLTRESEQVGSLMYMPPEQLASGPISERTDLYAVGVLLYELLSGRSPFAATDSRAMVAAIVRGRVEPLVEAPPALAAHIARAMSPLPSERFASAAEMARAIAFAFPPRAIASAAEGDEPPATDEMQMVFSGPGPSAMSTAPELGVATLPTRQSAGPTRVTTAHTMGARAAASTPWGPPTTPDGAFTGTLPSPMNPRRMAHRESIVPGTSASLTPLALPQPRSALRTVLLVLGGLLLLAAIAVLAMRTTVALLRH